MDSRATGNGWVAALAHLWFVTVHPFEDGNGRIARALADLLRARSEGTPQRFYSMSSQIQHDREDYYRVLEACQKGNLDVTAWMDWYLDCLVRAIGSSGQILADVLAKADFWRTHSGVPFNERQRQVVLRLLNGFVGKLTTSKWAKLAKCSQDTALRDVTDLLDRGVLAKEAAGGRSTRYTLVRHTPEGC